MIQSLTIRNFKSIKDATLTLGPLTVLVGANASGKTNLLEGVRLLSWMSVSGRDLRNIHRYLREGDLSLRGTPRTWVREGSREIGFGVKASLGEEGTPGELDVSLMVEDGSFVGSEERVVLTSGNDELIIQINEADSGDKKPHLSFSSGEPGVFQSGLTTEIVPSFPTVQISAVALRSEVPQDLDSSGSEFDQRMFAEGERYNGLYRSLISEIMFLSDYAFDTNAMREPEYEEDHTLSFDGANLQPSLFHITKRDPDRARLLSFVAGLPEEPITGLKFDVSPDHRVSLSLKETFGGKDAFTSAESLSDGTLHILGVATALLSAKPGSLVVFEEIDNWLHSSRMGMLFEQMTKVIEERNLQVLVTTHNAALLDHLPPSTLRDVHCCYRDPEEGDTRVTRLVDIERFPSLMAQGPLGSLITQGILDRFLKERGESEDLDPEVKAFLESLETSPGDDA